MRNDNYWKNQAKDFTKHYRGFKFFNLKNYVSKFLNKRTKIVLSLLGSVKNKTILDVGCGSGVHMESIVPKCKQITGIDFSEKMLLEAKEKLDNLSKNNWELKIVDVQEKFPFSDKSFDRIICIGLLDYVSSVKNVLLECHRVLKKNGFIIFTVPKKPSFFFFLRGSNGSLIRKKFLGLPTIENMVNHKELNLLLKESGFYVDYIKSIWTTVWVIKAIK